MSYRRWLLTLAVVGCLAVPAVAHAQGRLTPLVLGWEQHFKITQVETIQKGGKARVAGYLSNESGFKAARMRLLIDGYDASGQIVGQSIAYVPSPNPGAGGRVYFEEPAPAGVRHQVSVFQYDFVQAAFADAP